MLLQGSKDMDDDNNKNNKIVTTIRKNINSQ